MNDYNIEEILNNQKLNIDNMNKKELKKIYNLILNKPNCLEMLEKIFNKTKVYNNIDLHNIREPYWFEKNTNFFDNIWNIQIGETKFTLNFQNIKIDNNKFLNENIKILNTFKHWLCIQGHPIFNKGILIKPETLKINLSITIDFINYILLNSDKMELSKLDLLCIDNNFIIDFLTQLGLKGKSNGIYNYSSLVSKYLKENIKNIKICELKNFEKKYPLLHCNSEQIELFLDIDSIRKARYWIYKNTGYSNKSGNNNMRFFDKIYEGKILYTNKKFPSFDELKLTSYINTTEYPALPVITNEEIEFSYQTLQAYIKIIKSLTLVHMQEDCAQLSNYNLKEINIKRISREINLKKPGRYASLPADVTFKAIKDSFEYIHKYMDFLLELILDYLIYEKKYPSNSFKKFIEDHPKNDIIKKIGIDTVKIEKGPNYFVNLRKNNGLIDSYNVLLGSCLILIGALTARRSSEILELDAFNCIIPCSINPILNNTDFEIIFDNRKSGIGGEYFHREKLARPIPRSVALIIYKLQEFNKKIDMNKLINKKSLSLINFLSPLKLEFKKINPNSSGEILDTFCDYFETKIILDKTIYKRYYIRQHQLRRFFAMMFFWSKSFDGLDTLRYFLGHTDIEHLYYYITEPLTGAVLNGVKAHTLTEAYLGDNSIKIQNISSLREILLNHFKISDIELVNLNSSYLNTDKILILNKINYLLDEHIIDLKPNFFTITNSNGEIIQDYELILVMEDTL